MKLHLAELLTAETSFKYFDDKRLENVIYSTFRKNNQPMTRSFLLFIALFLFSATSTAQNQGYTYWQQAVDYTMDIDVDAEKHQYKGKQTLVYTNNSPDVIDRVYYHLYFNAFQPGSMMDQRSRSIPDPDGRVRDRIYYLTEDEIGYQKVRSLKQDGSALETVIEGTILFADLATPLQPGESTTLEMEWDAQVPLQVRRSGRDNAEGVEFTMTQWYPKLAEYDYMGWHPNPYVGREFHGPFGKFDVTIHIDKDYVVASTGVLQNPEEIGHGYDTNGKKVKQPKGKKLHWNFVAEDVIDFAWGADPDFVHTTAQVPNGPLLHFFHQITDDSLLAVNRDKEQQKVYFQNWKDLPEYTVGMFEYANKTFGKYPYPQYSVVQGGDGGMEYPMLTMITGARNLRSLVSVTVHEAYHSWFQGVLASNESYYSWMDEGFTSFAQAETMALLFKEEGNPYRGSYGGYRQIAKSGFEEGLDTHSDHFERNAAYGRAAYSKGAVFLGQMSYIVGEDVFRKGMLSYYDQWKLKHPTSQDFVRVMEKESEMILDWYHDYFVNQTTQIDFSIDSLNAQGENTTVHIGKKTQFPMPLDILVQYKDGSAELFYIPIRLMRGEKANEYEAKRTILEDWQWVAKSYSFEIPGSVDNIGRIIIDPSQRLADINLEDNYLDLTVKPEEVED